MQMVTIYKTGCDINTYKPRKAPDLQTGPQEVTLLESTAAFQLAVMTQDLNLTQLALRDLF